ncbi:MAG: hypothetical protein ABSE36_11745 [Terracidiphilus sp.]|jgi:hypothetical protein
MNGKLKLALQILFAVALIWFFAAVSGFAPGVRLRIGAASGKRCRSRRRKRFSQVASGVAGSWVDNPSQSFMPVGINGANF